MSILLQPFFLDYLKLSGCKINFIRAHFKRCFSGGAGKRIPTERVEADRTAQTLRDLDCRNTGRHGEAVRNSLRHSDNIRHRVLGLEAPKV